MSNAASYIVRVLEEKNLLFPRRLEGEGSAFTCLHAVINEALRRAARAERPTIVLQQLDAWLKEHGAARKRQKRYAKMPAEKVFSACLWHITGLLGGLGDGGTALLNSSFDWVEFTGYKVLKVAA